MSETKKPGPDGYITRPFEDIRWADELLNGGQPTSDDVALAAALCQLAMAKMTGRHGAL